MAQGTANKRFLAKSAKTTSARALLALVVAALLLTGCGGGSSDTSDSTAATSGAAGEAGTDTATADGAGVGAGGDTAAGAPSASEATGAGGSGTPAGQPSSAGKHGPAVPQPTGAPETGITPEQRRQATVASMLLQSPSSRPSSAGPPALPAEYTCDGKGTSPALRWQGVPQGTAELALLVMNTQPVDGELFFDWAVAGLSPELEEIEAGELPGEAIVGRNSFGKTGYEICPEGGGETYMFSLFALPKRLSLSRGFDPLDLRKAAVGAAGNVGLLALGYARG